MAILVAPPGASNTIYCRSGNKYSPGSDGTIAITNPDDLVDALRDGFVLPAIQATADGLVAFAGGGQSSATPLRVGINRFTVAGANDSAKLPVSQPGISVVVINASANSLNVFPASGEQINAAGANAAFAVTTGKTYR